MGLAIAEALVEEGANVAMFARRRETLEREADRLGALAIRGDVRDPRDLDNLLARTLEAFGGIDILVNNSGGPPRGPAVETDAGALEGAVDLLLLSAVRLTLACLPSLERSGHGRVINVGSSTIREPADNLALSNAIRPGLAGWMETLAREVGPSGTTINTLAPGRIDTERIREVYPEGPTEADLATIPLRRLGRADEVAALACFLASDRASYITGTVLPVDGGLTRGLL